MEEWINTKSQITLIQTNFCATVLLSSYILLLSIHPTNLETVLCFTGLLSPLLIFVFGCQGNTAAVIQILHEPKEGEFIEEDLWDLHQKVLPTVLESTAHKFTKRVLEQEKKVKCHKGCSSFDLLKKQVQALVIPAVCLPAVCGKSGQTLCFHHSVGWE